MYWGAQTSKPAFTRGLHHSSSSSPFTEPLAPKNSRHFCWPCFYLFFDLNRGANDTSSIKKNQNKSEGKTNFQKTEMLHAIFNLILFMLALEGDRNHSVKTYSKNKMSHHIEL